MSLNNQTDLCGVINIYKEKGYTSHDVVNIVRKALNKVKTGHTGTLDPDAEGVLPICIGKATKIAEYITADIKQYKAVVTLGTTTTTLDSTGDIIKVCDINCTKNEIESTVLSFKGEYMQTPPMYSAIKVNGKKLYELAREGKNIERKKRLIKIYDINIIDFIDEKNIKIDVVCSKGTYIRSLCSDIGEKLGCGAHMSELVRTRSGNFFIDDSITINKFKEIVSNEKFETILKSIDFVMPDYNKISIDKDLSKFLYNGNKISLNLIKSDNLNFGDKIFVYDFENRLIGIYEVLQDCIKPLKMLI